MTASAPNMRGYFAIGIEGANKPGNLGNLVRTAHAFGAAFAFTINSQLTGLVQKFDTAKAETAMPVFEFADLDGLQLPRHCRLVGVELCDQALDLPSFHHPHQAAYILGGERHSLSQATLDRCDFVVKIPTRFSLNVATAGAIVMYDRLRLLGRAAPRPVSPLGGAEMPVPHVHGPPKRRRAQAAGDGDQEQTKGT